MAHMFESFLASIPASRSEMVQDLEIPDLTISPYIWDPAPVDKLHRDSITSSEEEECSVSVDTESSIALSRAVTDSEIDYDRYKRYKRMNLSNRWEALSRAMDAFPADHISLLNSLHSDITESSDQTEDYIPHPRDSWLRDKELLLHLRQSFDEDCRAFEADDPCYLELEDALQSLDLEPLYADWDKMTY